MIKHLGESLTPFETQGFARIPELPVIGETVAVTCRVDGQEAIPRLVLMENGRTATLSGEALGNGRYRFQLGAYSKPQKVSYRFFTAAEETAWFSFDVYPKIAGLK
jgi:hypothetical protein